MCGVLGIIGPSTPSYAEHFPQALANLQHRGPNHRALLEPIKNACILGHTRLTILDEDPKANQPMENQAGALVYNGEIYNHQSLRNNFTYHTHSDTETLLNGLNNEGPDFFKHTQGMYAGAYFNKTDNTLLLFRDPVGIKPLYYTVLADSTLVFASEIKAILALLPNFSRRINKKTLATYLTFENWGQGDTFFEGIYLLKPGRMLNISLKSNVSTVLHDLPLPKIQNDFNLTCDLNEITEFVRCQIEETVQQHLLSDFPVATYLSGGLDSGTVTYLAAQKNPSLHAFCGYFEAGLDHYDERPRARTLAKHANVHINEVNITPNDFTRHFDTLTHTLEEPRMGMGSFSQFMVAKAVANSHRVILAGHGGDEIFYGYPLHKAVHALEQKGLSRMVQLAKLKPSELPWMLAYMGNRLKGHAAFVPFIFNPNTIAALTGTAPNMTEFSANRLTLSALSDYYQNTYLPGLLMVEDKISMHHSLETRVPLCDYALTQAISAIPANLKILNQQPKGLMKQAIQPWLPDDIIHGPKRGFPTPLRLWFRSELKDYVHDTLNSSKTLHTLFSKQFVDQTLKEYSNIRFPSALEERHAHRIWMLLSVAKWSECYTVTL